MATRTLMARGEIPAAYYRTGRWIGLPGTTSTLAPGLNGCRVGSLHISKAVTFDRIALEVTTLGSAGAVMRLGIWNDDGNGQPGTVLLDAGTIDATSNGVKEITISQAVTPGLYWLGAAVQVAVSTWRTTVSALLPISAESSATLTSNPQAGYTDSQSGALATFTATPTMSGSAPRVMLRIA